MQRLLLTAVLTLSMVAPVHAQSLDAASAEALAATLRILQDPALRAGVLGSDPGAAAADRQLRSLAGSEALTHELYALAAQVFGELARASGGDLQKMVEALDRGRIDPAGFAAQLSPETLRRLRELSTKIPDRAR